MFIFCLIWHGGALQGPDFFLNCLALFSLNFHIENSKSLPLIVSKNHLNFLGIFRFFVFFFSRHWYYENCENRTKLAIVHLRQTKNLDMYFLRVFFGLRQRSTPLPWDFTVSHNDPAASLDHCGRSRIRTEERMMRKGVERIEGVLR